MSEFQIGDRVSIAGVVTQLWPDAKPCPLTLVRINNESSCDDITDLWFEDTSITLVERPRPKLRVGSVWERWGIRYVVGTDSEGHRQLVNLATGGIAEVGLICASPDVWREVPVEELEREAQRGDS